MKCVCGCGKRAVHQHHVIYQQHLRQHGGDDKDRRNLVPMAHRCHGTHHSGAHRLSLTRLPDSVFVFAEELLGPGGAYEYLRRRYANDDWRLEELLARSEGKV